VISFRSRFIAIKQIYYNLRV